MPNLAVHISGLVLGTTVQISFQSFDEDGLTSGGEIDKDFAATVGAEETAIKTAAKLAHTAAHETVFDVGDEVHVYGGRIS